MPNPGTSNTLSRDELEALARKYWDAKKQGDTATVKAMVHPEIVWKVVGANAKLAREYVGAEEYFSGLVQGLAQEFVPGEVQLNITAVYADDKQHSAIVCLDEKALTRGGELFQAQIVQIMKFNSEGQLLRCEEYMDLAEVLRTFHGQEVHN